MIQEIDLTILHRFGKEKANADALSHNPTPMYNSVNGIGIVMFCRS